MIGTPSAVPPSQGLYDPSLEHDACGVAFLATLTGVGSHAIVADALTALRNLEHRGASGSEPSSGDGAGILIRVPDTFLREVTDFALPPEGQYAVGIAFLPVDPGEAVEAKRRIERIAADEALAVLGWRSVPIDPSEVGATARSVMPSFEQLFVASSDVALAGIDLDRRAFCMRKRVEHEVGVYFPSLSCRTIVYKGMLTTAQLEPFYPDLSDERVASPLALVHSRFSTNTFPSWPLAHPLPVHLAQRRDQHSPGQSQLDAGARVDAHLGRNPG